VRLQRNRDIASKLRCPSELLSPRGGERGGRTHDSRIFLGSFASKRAEEKAVGQDVGDVFANKARTRIIEKPLPVVISAVVTLEITWRDVSPARGCQLVSLAKRAPLNAFSAALNGLYSLEQRRRGWAEFFVLISARRGNCINHGVCDNRHKSAAARCSVYYAKIRYNERESQPV